MQAQPLILGHRGAAALAPENTLTAFARAMNDGADGIEFDVRLTGDGVPVVIHDSTLKRTASIDRAVSEVVSADLQRIDVGAWFGTESRYKGELLPKLSQVFEFFAGKDATLYLEMKGEASDREKLAQSVVATIQQYEFMEHTVVLSFDHSAVKSVKAIDSRIRTAALFGPRLRSPAAMFRPSKILTAASACGADELALHHRLVTRDLVTRAKQSGFALVVWTVDDPKWIARAQSLGLKALITNDPAKMSAHRKRTLPD